MPLLTAFAVHHCEPVYFLDFFREYHYQGSMSQGKGEKYASNHNVSASTNPNQNVQGDYFDEEQTLRLNRFRFGLYAEAGYGAAAGFVSALVLSGILRLPLPLPLTSLQRYRSKNVTTFGLLLFPTLGAFISTTVYGKNNLHSVHDIFAKKAHPENVPDEQAEQSTSNNKYSRQLKQNALNVLEEADASYARRQASIQMAKHKRADGVAHTPQDNDDKKQ